MSHAANWSADKRRRIAGEIACEARLRQPVNLKRMGLRAWGRCQKCSYQAPIDLDALIERGHGQKDVIWGSVGLKCSNCQSRYPEVLVEWEPGVLRISPPTNWPTPITPRATALL